MGVQQEADTLVFYCNGRKVKEPNADPECSLATYIREKLKLTGTKIACGQGGCGACTVMLSTYCHATSEIHHLAVNACLMPICAVHGMSVTTIEALGSIEKGLHPVQERIAKFHGSQCGFCTPGMVMSMYTLLRNNPKPTQEDIETVLQGNLCRCTGYRPILQAFNTFTDDFNCPMGESCCQNKDKSTTSKSLRVKVIAEAENDIKPYDPSQELIFPSELQLNDSYTKKTVQFHGSRVTWIRPVSLEEFRKIRREYPDAHVLAGNTGLGLTNWFQAKVSEGEKAVVIYAKSITELTWHNITDDSVIFGSALSLNEVNNILQKVINAKPEHQTRGLKAMHSMIQRFSGHQIRNVVTLGGNIANATPALDVNTVLAGLGSKVKVLHDDGQQEEFQVDENFFQGYRLTPLKPTDLVLFIQLPLSKKRSYIFSFKQGRKRNNDAPIVNACFNLELNESKVIEQIRLVYGGVADRTVVATKTAAALKQKKWTDQVINIAVEELMKEIQISTGAPGGKEEYRRTLLASLFHKFYLAVEMQLQNRDPKEVTDLYPREPCKGAQVIVEVPPGQDSNDPIGRPVEHVSAFKQATGEARYIDDIPKYEDELHAALVLSSRAHAKIVEIYPSTALTLPGVVAFYSFGTDNVNTAVFAQGKVEAEGQVIGAVVAESHDLAQRAAKLVSVKYEDLPAIITLEDAIEAKSYLGEKFTIRSEKTEDGFKGAQHVFEGEVRVGGQKHFYLETQSSLVVPRGEDGALDIYTGTQWPHFIQMQVASTFGLQANKVEVHTKRLGGAFGGKGGTPLIPTIAAAVAATDLKRPVRCVLSRDDDMIAIGSKHTYLAKYKVGCNNDGKITGVDIQMFSNGGYHPAVTAHLMEVTMVYSDSAYKMDNQSVQGTPMKTNTPSNITSRSAGSFQGVFFAETIMHHIATELNLDPEKIREMHLYKEGDTTYYGQTLENVTVRRCWQEVMQTADVERRKKEVAEFNKNNKWKKRGIAVVPVKYGIGFPSSVMCQAGALIQVYLDGSVLLSHGGIEFGQGLNTKMIQVASRALGIPMELIHINEASTATVPNASPSGGSTNTDLYGGAVLDACQTLNERLKAIKDSKPEGTWKDWINAAYGLRISLSVTGFYKVTGITDMDWTTGRGSPFPYYTFGAACSEVEIDVLTGAHTIIRTDMVIDVGQSLNPAIDVGQIEGAFVMGTGLSGYEERLYTQDGKLITRGPINYKVPGVTDIPSIFNVSILKGASNPKAVYSSKGIGEPTMFCSLSVFFAIKEAILAARIQNGLGPGHFRLNSPATSEAIRLACGDSYVQKSQQLTDNTKKPWAVLV